MKPTVISNANSKVGSSQSGGNGINIPIKKEVGGQSSAQQPQAQHYMTGEPQVTAYGSPNTAGRPIHSQHPYPQQEIPAHFQDFDFEPDMGMDMFPRSRLGRMAHDPFGDFGGNTRKRTSLHDPEFHNDGFSRYFDDATDFGFPQFNSLGRRRINPHSDDDFFKRLPSEFRQYIPESFSQRRGGSGVAGSPSSSSPSLHLQHPPQHHSQTHFYNTMPQSPSKIVCDAAIQTEDPAGRSEVDHANSENLNQHGLRNTMDMGVKSPIENENHGTRSLSAPPTEQQQNQNQQFYTKTQKIPNNGLNRKTSPPQQQQFCSQTSPLVQTGAYGGQSPQFQKGPQQNVHLQQKQQTPPPQTPGGSYVRTIPIFVEGRSEPIINNKEIPNQTPQASAAASSGNSRAFTPLKKQPHRPTPLHTQQEHTSQENQHSSHLPPQTPHTVDTINKIQDIQRDVLDLMSRVEKFSGTRADKEYAFLDEMLTRNLLKLDNIDTNGKESIRLARKEAIKCIQASINVLEAKAEENKKSAEENLITGIETKGETSGSDTAVKDVCETQKSSSAKEITKEATLTFTTSETLDSTDTKKNNEPIPLPPPESQKFNEVKIEDCPEDDALTEETRKDTPGQSENKIENTTETK